jgi:hypothetical protein
VPPTREDGGMGRLVPAAPAVAAGLTLALLGGIAGATTTTTRPRPPRAFTPSVSPSTIDNRSGCSRPTSATVSTGTTGDAKKVTFKVQVGGRTTTLYASGSGSRWSATLNGSAFGPDHGSGTVRATATGPGGSTESGPAGFTITDCPA